MVIKDAVDSETTDSCTMKTQKESDKTVIIAQEIKFARALAGNDPKLRTKVLKNLKTWLTTRSQSTFAFSDADFLRLWKGLFYCMWMSDKPLIQEELAESVGSLLRCFEHDVPVALQFFRAFMVTMGIEWFGLDRWRMDKFMMFVRRVTRQLLFVMHENGWQIEHVNIFRQTIETTVLNNEVCPFGLTNHFNDLLLEEIAKVSDGEVPKEVITQIVEPYVRYLLKNDDSTVNRGIVKNVFHALMQQSDLGQMYDEKFDIWKRSNFVTGDIDNVEFDVEYQYEDDEPDDDDKQQENTDAEENGKEEMEENGDGEHKDEDENEDENQDDGEEGNSTEKVYDPRAGRVGVEIPQIEFDPVEIVSLFEKYRYKPYVSSKGKKSAILLVRQLNKFANGVYPLGIKHVPSINPKDYKVDIDEQVEDLENFRKNLYGEKESRSWKEMKKEKQRKRKLLREQKEDQIKRSAVMVPNGDTYAEPESNIDETEHSETIATTEQDETDASGSVEEKVPSKKKSKSRKKNPAMLKKQTKLELLNRKKQEKMMLLKERLKKNKSTVPSNEIDDSDKSNDNTSSSTANESPGSLSKVKQPKLTSRKAEPVMKKQRTKHEKAAKQDSKPFETIDEWSEPLKEGEEEYFIPSRKLKSLQKPTSHPVLARVSKAVEPSLKRASSSASAAVSSDVDLATPIRKRVKIALCKNVAQDLVEHIEQVKSSPQLPFDSSKKPSKSLLKPNLIPSPINPFYKKKIGLK